MVLPVKVYLEEVSISSVQLCVNKAPTAIASRRSVLLNLDIIFIAIPP
jgi:hypothetical protein